MYVSTYVCEYVHIVCISYKGSPWYWESPWHGAGLIMESPGFLLTRSRLTLVLGSPGADLARVWDETLHSPGVGFVLILGSPDDLGPSW